VETTKLAENKGEVDLGEDKAATEVKERSQQLNLKLKPHRAEAQIT